MKKSFLILGASLCLIIILSGCQNPFVNKPIKTTEIKPETTVNETDTNQAVGIANPASTNCIEKGGKIEMRKNKNGEYGVCLFEDNRQCEEWAFFRGQCPIGGLKITGYDNDAEIYCAITGGQVEGVGTPVPMCKRIDGTYCNAQANLDGECPDPNDTNPNAGNVEAE
jgi:hypothetical protein